MSKLVQHPIFKLALALSIASLVLFLFYRWSPQPRSSNDLIINEGKWTESTTGATFDVIAGREMASQVPASSPCCNGFYEFVIPESEKVLAGRLQPALYISTISCGTSLSLNGKSVPLKTPEFTSVGPVIPLPTSSDQYPMTIRIDTECPRLMTTGLWKRALRIGEYLDLVAFQTDERNFQIVTPLVSSVIFAAIGFGFLAIFFLTDRRFRFYLDVSFGLISWSSFLVFLAGIMREIDPWFGSAFHLPFRVVAACGAFFVVRAYLTVITEAEGRHHRRSGYIILVYGFLSALCLYFSITGQIQKSAITVGIASLSAYILIVRWPLRSLKLNSIGYIAFVVCLTTWIGAASDVLKIVSPQFDFSYNIPYFNRYTANLFMTTAVILFMRQFVGIYQKLQNESLRAAKASATGRAVRMIAHDVRAPFTSVQMGLLLLGKAKGDQDRIDDLLSRLEVHLNQSVERVNRMLKDVMTFGGELRIERAQIFVKSLIDDVVSSVAQTQSFAVTIDPRCGEISVDRDKLHRALGNIAENAAQAATPGTNVSLEAVPESRGRTQGIRITVRNFGKTIPVEKQEKIFSEFYTEGKVGGTGLGLAIAKEFVEGHGGVINCESDAESGTRFHVWIPS